MADQAKRTDWFIRDPSQQWGPMGEVELRRELWKKPVDNLWVRQGNSDWVDAKSVRKKFAELVERGVYLRRDESQVEGPFTAARAFEMLRAMDRAGVETRVGRHAHWYPADRLYRRLAELVEKTPANKPDDRGRTVPSPQQVLEPSDDLPMAVVVDVPMAIIVDDMEILDAIPVDSPTRSSAVSTAELNAPDAVAISASRGVAQSQAMRGPGSQPAAASRMGAKKNVSPVKRGLIIAACGLTCFLLLASGGLFVLYRWSTNRGETATTASESSFPTSSTVRRSHRVPPPVLPGTLFRPTFHTRAGVVEAGTAFTARFENSEETVLLSALHLLGPAGGLPSDVPSQQIPTFWQNVSLLDCRSGQDHHHVPGKPLLLEGTKPFPTVSSVGDVIGFRIQANQRFHPYEIATEQPQPGDPVWLVSEVIDNPRLVHAAHVVGEVESWLAYEFVAPQVELRATSGAPVLNAAHQVIAVNAGGGNEAGRTIGLGTPVSQFRDSLSRALQRN